MRQLFGLFFRLPWWLYLPIAGGVAWYSEQAAKSLPPETVHEAGVAVADLLGRAEAIPPADMTDYLRWSFWGLAALIALMGLAKRRRAPRRVKNDAYAPDAYHAHEDVSYDQAVYTPPQEIYQEAAAEWEAVENGTAFSEEDYDEEVGDEELFETSETGTVETPPARRRRAPKRRSLVRAAWIAAMAVTAVETYPLLPSPSEIKALPARVSALAEAWSARPPEAPDAAEPAPLRVAEAPAAAPAVEETLPEEAAPAELAEVEVSLAIPRPKRRPDVLPGLIPVVQEQIEVAFVVLTDDAPDPIRSPAAFGTGPAMLIAAMPAVGAIPPALEAPEPPERQGFVLPAGAAVAPGRPEAAPLTDDTAHLAAIAPADVKRGGVGFSSALPETLHRNRPFGAAPQAPERLVPVAPAASAETTPAPVPERPVVPAEVAVAETPAAPVEVAVTEAPAPIPDRTSSVETPARDTDSASIVEPSAPDPDVAVADETPAPAQDPVVLMETRTPEMEIPSVVETPTTPVADAPVAVEMPAPSTETVVAMAPTEPATEQPFAAAGTELEPAPIESAATETTVAVAEPEPVPAPPVRTTAPETDVAVTQPEPAPVETGATEMAVAVVEPEPMPSAPAGTAATETAVAVAVAEPTTMPPVAADPQPEEVTRAQAPAEIIGTGTSPASLLATLQAGLPQSQFLMMAGAGALAVLLLIIALVMLIVMKRRQSGPRDDPRVDKVKLDDLEEERWAKLSVDAHTA